jgi:hypothetical protein
VHFFERYFSISLGREDGSIEALILVVLFMLIAILALRAGKTLDERKRESRN